MAQANELFELQRKQLADAFEQIIKNANPDPDFHQLIGSSVQKAAGDQLGQKLRDYERRLKHGAPVQPSQLTRETAATVAARLFPNGKVQLDQTLVITAPEREPEQELVDPTKVLGTLKETNPGKLAKVLSQGGRTRPRLIAHPGQGTYTDRDGGELIIAALVTNLPLIAADVEFPETTEPSPGAIGPNLQDLVQDSPHGYRVPSWMEPWANLARVTTQPDFNALVDNRPSDSMVRLRQAVKTYWGLIKADFDQIARYDTLLDKTAQQLELQEQRWTKLLGAAMAARTLSQKYREEDGLTEDTDPKTIWSEAQGRKITYEDALRIPPGTPVEVLDGRNRWRAGAVERRLDNGIVVWFNDGGRRFEDDPTRVKEIRREYEEPMTEAIHIDAFNVFIPKGTNSWRIEQELEESTIELNTQPLRVNKDTWLQNRAAITKEVDQLTEQCRQEANWPEFRPNASADCIKVFIKERGLRPQRVSKKTGVPSLDKETLQFYQATGDQLAGLVIQCREAMSKLSQLEAWATYADTGRVQATWNQLGTPHGRYSCDSPNLQNRITEIRETIEADEGHLLLSFDLGQAEYVTWASLSKDPILTAAFQSDRDFHLRMFEEIRALVPDLSFSDPDRQVGKTFNFAQLYLMNAFTLAKRLGITQEQATQIAAAYAARAPIAIAYRDDTIAKILREGRTTTKFGRVRLMPDIKSLKGPALHEATKTAWHHHNAGTAAEILKIKQVRTWKLLRRLISDPKDGRLVLQMHDELVFSIREDLLPKVKDQLLEKFVEPIPDFLPFKVEVRSGPNWLSTSK